MIRKILNIIKWIAICYVLLIVNAYLVFLALRIFGLLNMDKPFPTGTISAFLLAMELLAYRYWRKRTNEPRA